MGTKNVNVKESTICRYTLSCRIRSRASQIKQKQILINFSPFLLPNERDHN